RVTTPPARARFSRNTMCSCKSGRRRGSSDGLSTEAPARRRLPGSRLCPNRGGRVLIYGANGYTGRLAAQHAVERGLRPVLAGRSTAEVRALADELGFEWRAFPLDNPAAVREALDGITAVLHAAGPFSATSKPMADACIATGTHYIDITGEIPVFEALVARDAEARDAGTVLLPGAGFDVAPSDCLAAHVKQRLPSATRLRLGIQPGRSVSRGTARTMIEGAARGTAVRRNGRIVELAEMPTASIDFG